MEGSQLRYELLVHGNHGQYLSSIQSTRHCPLPIAHICQCQKIVPLTAHPPCTISTPALTGSSHLLLAQTHPLQHVTHGEHLHDDVEPIGLLDDLPQVHRQGAREVLHGVHLLMDQDTAYVQQEEEVWTRHQLYVDLWIDKDTA